MADIDKIEISLKNISSILSAADGVLKNPKNSFESELKKEYNGQTLANSLVRDGAIGIVAASGAASVGSGIATLLGGMGAAATAATVSGPVGWAIVGAAVVLTGGYLYRKWKRAQQAQQEKDRLKNEIIRKQQAIINELKKENARNAQEIRNLKETLAILEELLRKMSKAA